MTIDTAKEKLTAEKMRLESEMAEMGRKNPRVPGDWEPVPTEIGTESDLADQADVVMERDTSTAIFSDLEARYDSVLAALKRIDEGTYGTCSVCGEPIEAARLGADPSATTCVAHK